MNKAKQVTLIGYPKYPMVVLGSENVGVEVLTVTWLGDNGAPYQTRLPASAVVPYAGNTH